MSVLKNLTDFCVSFCHLKFHLVGEGKSQVNKRQNPVHPGLYSNSVPRETWRQFTNLHQTNWIWIACCCCCSFVRQLPDSWRIFSFMAIRSLRNKRSNPKPYSPMASRAKPWNHRKVSLIFFITLILGVVLLMGISSNMWRKFKYGASSLPTVYSIEVINEFPHDPGAFTQVTNLFL